MSFPPPLRCVARKCSCHTRLTSEDSGDLAELALLFGGNLAHDGQNLLRGQ
jgi:hypothetical protein